MQPGEEFAALSRHHPPRVGAAEDVVVPGGRAEGREEGAGRVGALGAEQHRRQERVHLSARMQILPICLYFKLSVL